MEIKRFVLLTASGEGCAIAWQAKRQGLDVMVGIVQNWEDTLTETEKRNKGKSEKPHEQERRLMSFKDMLPILPIEKVVKILGKLSEEEKRETFVFSDINYLFKYAQQVAALGIPGMYPTEADREFEGDREAAKQFVKTYYKDLKVAEYHEFNTIEDGIRFLEEAEEENIWVLKGNDSGAETFVPKTRDIQKAKQQIINVLENEKADYEKGGFILEKKIIDPLEITPQIVFYDGEFVFADVDIELKHRGAGDTDITVGCAANLIFSITPDDPVFQVAFPEKVFEMAKLHKGMFVWDASILIDPKDNQMYFGEFCSNRCGYDAVYVEITMAGGVREFFSSIAEKKNPFAYSENKFGFSFRLFSSHDDPELAAMTRQDTELILDPGILNYVWPIYVYQKDGKYVTTGYSKDVLVVSCSAATIEDAMEGSYDYFKGVSFEDPQYRPLHDLLSTDYPTAIIKRFDYGNGQLYSVANAHRLFPEVTSAAEQLKGMEELMQEMERIFTYKLRLLMDKRIVEETSRISREANSRYRQEYDSKFTKLQTAYGQEMSDLRGQVISALSTSDNG